jgi:hypothetical protein
MMVIRLGLSALLIYYAVYGESKGAMTLILALIVLANELAVVLVNRKQDK